MNKSSSLLLHLHLRLLHFLIMNKSSYENKKKLKKKKKKEEEEEEDKIFPKKYIYIYFQFF